MKLKHTALVTATIAAATVLISCLAAPAAKHQTLSAEEAEQQILQTYLDTLTTRQKVAQLIVGYMSELKSEAEWEKTTKLVKQDGIGGLIVGKQEDTDWAKKRIKDIQKIADIPVLFCIDGEYGAAMRFPGFEEFPRQKSLGAVPADSVRAVGEAIGRQIRSLGIQLNFAPVVDLAFNSTRSVGNRSFGQDPHQVAERGVAMMKGMQAGGLLTCAKHFPGHGACITDSHVDISRITMSAAGLDTTHIVPFKAMIAEGVDLVMVGHLVAPALDSTGTAASVSKTIITGLLREKLGFKGVIITDALTMKGLPGCNAHSGVDVAVAAYKAGADILLMPADAVATIDTLTAMVGRGELPLEGLNERVARVLALKRKAGLLKPFMSHDTMAFQGLEREYYFFNPVRKAEGKPLIVMLHGYGGNAKGYRPEMVEAAMRHGYAICVPMGAKSDKGKNSWNVRYPAQEHMTTDDVAFVSALVDTVAARYGLNPANAFLTGMSNGGEMCYIFAYKQPERFKAIASVAGLTMAWLPAEVKPSGRVPFFEIHGTADKTSMWEGDLQNEGGWGAYLGVEDAVGRIVAMNGCSLRSSEDLPLLRDSTDVKGASRKVTLHTYDSSDGCKVLLYQVHGGKHSWHLDDIDTCEEIMKFFSQYCK